MNPEPNSFTTREISSNEVQVLEIDLKSLQFLEISIDKGDLNLSLKVISPGNEILTEQTSYRFESLVASVVTDNPGIYRLEISSLERDQGARGYRLTVDRVRPATKADLKRAAARKAFGMANALRADWQQGSLLKSLTKYEEAGTLWRTSQDFAAVADTLIAAAEVHFALGEYRKTLTDYQLAVSESRRARDGLREMSAAGSAGLLSSYLGDNDMAERSLKRVIEFYRRQSTRASESRIKLGYAGALHQIGEVYYAKGDLSRASHAFQDSLSLSMELADRSGEAWARLFMGYTNATLGEPETSLTAFAKAQQMFAAVRDRRGEALCITAIGSIHSRRGAMQPAIRLHREAMQIFRTIGDTQSEAITFNSIGQAYEHVNERDIAIDNYEEALKRFQATGNVDFAIATIYQLGRLYKTLGDNQLALRYYEQCIKLSVKTKKRRMEAYALNDIAAIYAGEGRRDQTLKQYQGNLGFYRAIGDRRGEALTLNSIGDMYASIKDYVRALKFYKRAVQPSQKADEEVQITTLHNIAQTAREAGDLKEAYSYIQQAVRKIEEIRTNLAVPEQRTSYAAAVNENYHLLIEILMQQEEKSPGQGFATAALLTSERSRARSLLEVLVEAKANLQPGMDPTLSERARELRRQLREKEIYQSSVLMSGSAQDESGEIARGIRELKAESQVIEAQLRERNPHYAALVQPPQFGLEEIQSELIRDDSILLEYSLGDEKSYLWAVTSNSLTAYELPSRKEIEQVATDVYAALTARQKSGGQDDAQYGERVDAADKQYPIKALMLSKMLLGPVAQQLGERRLLIVAEGSLQYIPFDALPDPGLQQGANEVSTEAQPILLRHEVVMLPSFSILATIRREKTEVSPQNVLAVLADPVFSKNDNRLKAAVAPSEAINAVTFEPGMSVPRALRRYSDLADGANLHRLPHTSDEADAIVSVAPRGTWLIAKGFAANRETAMSSEFGRYQILHFATHGLFDSEHPDLSSIVLSQVDKDGRTQDGLIQLQDIYNLKVASNLVVLSACNTALGKTIQGEGIISLTRGFMYAGSRSVVATVWSVDDVATTQLMPHFYTGLLQQGLPPGAALRKAKLELRKDKRWRAPYFWAGFVLEGEYREPIALERRSPYAVGGVFTLVLIIGVMGFVLLFKRRLRR